VAIGVACRSKGIHRLIAGGQRALLEAALGYLMPVPISSTHQHHNFRLEVAKREVGGTKEGDSPHVAQVVTCNSMMQADNQRLCQAGKALFRQGRQCLFGTTVGMATLVLKEMGKAAVATRQSNGGRNKVSSSSSSNSSMSSTNKCSATKLNIFAWIRQTISCQTVSHARNSNKGIRC